jgi:hypothetical protein
MSRTATVKVSAPTNDEIWIACGTCDRETSHRILTKVAEDDTNEHHTIQVWNSFLIVQCQGCKTVSYCHESTCTEDEHYNEETGESELIPTRTLYPSRKAGRAKVDGLYDLPQGVRGIYTETHAALCNNLPVLAGVGIRALIEASAKRKMRREGILPNA